MNLARELIENYVQDNWAETPVAYQDVPYKVMKSIDFVALNIIWSGSEVVGLQSDSPLREYGMVIFECFTAPNIGSETMLTLCGLAREVFNEKTLGALTFQTGTSRRIGVVGDFLKYMVEIPFYYQG